MSKKAKNVLFLIVFFAILIGLMAVALLKGKIQMNPSGTIGNTAGNLNNGGLFCESDGKIYFSNAYDEGCMYVMDQGETNLNKLNHVKTRNILAGGDYLYYFQLGASGKTGIGNIRSVKSFNRSEKDGSKTVGLTRDVVVTAQLVDNYLYLLTSGDTNPEFYKLKIDKSDKVMLAKYNINPACVLNGAIYYNGTQDDHYLYRLDTSNDTPSVVWKGNLWYPILEGDYVYYMDVANNYRLCRYSISQDVIEVLTNDRVDCFNLGSGYIYYQKNSQTQPQLKYMKYDGSEATVLAEGNYTNINMTSQYVYFQKFNYDAELYHTMIGGSEYSTFDAAREAALEFSK